jgi:hypothetical protein
VQLHQETAPVLPGHGDVADEHVGNYVERRGHRIGG